MRIRTGCTKVGFPLTYDRSIYEISTYDTPSSLQRISLGTEQDNNYNAVPYLAEYAALQLTDVEEYH